MQALSPVSASELPKAFGRYLAFDRIGRGGMAQIYVARAETELGATRLVAIKEILEAYAGDPAFADMLVHEAKLAAKLSNRHVVQVHELGRVDGALFIAMEYVEGFDLASLLRQCTEKKTPFPEEHALGVVVDVLEGLEHAHRVGIVHRDVSPSNVLVSFEGEVKLCDFGIAHANDLVRETEALKGKAGYMSPEQALGEALDARADVFAAGIILWELLAGRRLYTPRSETPLLDQARRAEIPPLPDKGLPEHAALEAIVRRALARDREARHASAAAFRRELEDYLARVGLLASRLKLGEWIAGAFGTEIIERRRESERRLPKSAPPPRASHLRAKSTPSGVPQRLAPDVSLPPPPRLPSFAPPPAESLTGAELDVPPSSRATPRGRALAIGVAIGLAFAVITIATMLVR